MPEQTVQLIRVQTYRTGKIVCSGIFYWAHPALPGTPAPDQGRTIHITCCAQDSDVNTYGYSAIPKDGGEPDADTPDPVRLCTVREGG